MRSELVQARILRERAVDEETRQMVQDSIDDLTSRLLVLQMIKEENARYSPPAKARTRRDTQREQAQKQASSYAEAAASHPRDWVRPQPAPLPAPVPVRPKDPTPAETAPPRPAPKFTYAEGGPEGAVTLRRIPQKKKVTPKPMVATPQEAED